MVQKDYNTSPIKYTEASTLADALNKLGVYQTNTAFLIPMVKADAQKSSRNCRKKK
jgi:hypothetical protein